MKTKLYLKTLVLLSCLGFCEWANGQGIPELLYYRFNEKGTTVTNMASAPPSGASVADIKGNQNQTATGTCGGTGLLGTGDSSTADYVDTKWMPNMTGSWTISVWINRIDTITQFYLFGENTATFRCIANGASGRGTLLLRSGTMVDLKADVAFHKGANVVTFVYDSAKAVTYAYVNGILNNTVNQSPTVPISIKSTANFKVGGYSNFTGLLKGGIMDEFRFYKRALSATEVARLRYIGNTSRSITPSLCDVTSFKGASGKTFTTSGIFNDTIRNYFNCDSIITYLLTFSVSTSKTIAPVACERYVSPSGKYTWTKTGVYKDTLKNLSGCDSFVTVNLTVNYNSTNTLTIQDCDSNRSPSGKYYWYKSGTYYDTIPNHKGCDSIVTVNLTIYYSKPVTLQIAECNSYLSPSGKHVWTTSGTYLDTVPNKLCSDSVITVQLTILKSTAASISPTACYSYTSTNSMRTWTVSGVYRDTIKNAAGCDSVISINLTINNATAATISKTTCDRYESPSKKYFWDTTGTYSDSVQNTNGCDSIITVNLTVNSVDVGVTRNVNTLTANATGAVYKWLDCKAGFNPISGQTGQSFKATVDGDYAVLVTQNGCSDTSVCTSITVVGIAPNSFSRQLSVYPNPMNGYFRVQSTSMLSHAEIRIFGVRGELMKEIKGLEGNDFTVDLSDKTNGVYFIEIIENEKVARFKLLKY